MEELVSAEEGWRRVLQWRQRCERAALVRLELLDRERAGFLAFEAGERVFLALMQDCEMDDIWKEARLEAWRALGVVLFSQHTPVDILDTAVDM
jgi:hypothetical protein